VPTPFDILHFLDSEVKERSRLSFIGQGISS